MVKILVHVHQFFTYRFAYISFRKEYF